MNTILHSILIYSTETLL